MQPRTQGGSNEASRQWPGACSELPWSGKPREKLTGLLNQGGTCYLNTLLQTLLHTPEFTFRLFNLTKSIRKEQLKRMIQEMLNLFLALITTGGGAISSKPLTDSFGWTEDEVCVHQDIQELNRLLFEQIEIALKGTSETNLINDLYRGIQCTRIRCLQCGRVSERNDEFQDINLSVMDHDSVEDSLLAHTQLERLTGDNQYFCESCQCKVDAVKVTRFEELPPILTLSLSRFYFDAKQMQSVKLEKMCSFPLLLDMSSFFVNKTNKKVKYNLFSIVLHVGGSTGGGHYHAFIKDPYGTVREASKDSASNNKWREPTIQKAMETTDSVIESSGHDAKSTESDDYIPFADNEPIVDAPSKSYRIGSIQKKTCEGDRDTHQDHKISSRQGSCPIGQVGPSRSQFSDSMSCKLPPGGLNRLLSPPLLSDSDRAGDHEGRNEQTSKATDFAGSSELTSRSALGSSHKISDPPGVNGIFQLVGRLKNSLSIDSTIKSTGQAQKSTDQRANRGHAVIATQKELQCKPKQTFMARTKREVHNTTARSIQAEKRGQTYSRPTDAISIYPIKRTSPPQTEHHRSRSAHATGYGQNRKELAKLTRKKPKQPTPLCKPSPLTRQLRRSSYRDESDTNLHKNTAHRPRVRGVPSAGFPSLQMSQHNSGSQGSASSTTSPPQSPARRRDLETRLIPPINDYVPSRCVWRSRLFDGSNSDDRLCVKRRHSNSIHPALQSGDPFPHSSSLIPRSVIATDRTLCSTDSTPPYGQISQPLSSSQVPPEFEDTLDSIPTMQRTNAHCPSHWSQSRDADLGSSRVTSRTLTYGRSTDYNSFCERNSFNQSESVVHLNTEQEELGNRKEIDESDESNENDRRETERGLHEPCGNNQTETAADCQHSRRSSGIKDSQGMEDNTEVVIGRWFDFNDDCIMEVDPSTFSRVFEGPECAYMLFYRRTNLPDPIFTLNK